MTSIEWLINQIHKKQYGDYPNITFENIFKEAGEMHKEEIEDAFQDGKWDWNEHITNGTESKDLEQYYNETFKQKTNG